MSSNCINSNQFWKAILIWLKNSHVINRRLCGVANIAVWNIPNNILHINDIISKCLKITFEQLISNEHEATINTLFINDLFVMKSFNEIEHVLNNTNDSCESYYVILQKLLPRSSKYKDTYQLSILDLRNNHAVFINVCDNSTKIFIAPNQLYHLKLISNKINIESSELQNVGSMKWLEGQLIPRLEKWALYDTLNPNGILNGSLNLVSLTEYNKLYQELKDKYGQHIVNIWPEVTDPSKFVYEDVAIATYLLLLWKNERNNLSCDKKQSFLDLGCGNGLLVYILSSEGHPGKGLDIRKRGIWDMYPDYVHLEVKPVEPTENCLYKDVDWLIGNHSDELTPWIPVIAARSSYDCKFFLLPCCAYNFDGTKYQRKDSSKSQYNEYLEYVQIICEKCGIYTQVDRLKIPSTKRICLIGTNREYPIIDHEMKLLDLRHFVESTNEKDDKITNNGSWMNNFKPREAIESVRNCTKVDKNIINDIIKIVSSKLLSEKKYVNNWNAGGCLPISEIPNLIPDEMLKYLKKECGGLQTLFKNNHNIFEVSCGTVKFRYPKSKEEYLLYLNNKKEKRNKSQKNKKIEYQIKPCWFYNNHPDGCPLILEECRFAHTLK